MRRGTGFALSEQRVVWNPDFDLYCSEHRTDWDDCIAQFINSGKDAQRDFLPEQVRIPLFPSQGVWAAATLLENERTGYKNAHVKLKFIDKDFKNWVELGTLLPGEGRKVLRELLIEWLRGQPMVCSAPTHAYHEQKYLSQLSPGSVETIKETWHIALNGVCTKCNGYNNPDEDVPEL